MIIIRGPIVYDIYKDSNKNTIYHWISDLPTILVEINTVVKQIAIKTRGHIDDLSHKLIPEFPDFVRSEYAQSINKIYITQHTLKSGHKSRDCMNVLSRNSQFKLIPEYPDVVISACARNIDRFYITQHHDFDCSFQVYMIYWNC